MNWTDKQAFDFMCGLIASSTRMVMKKDELSITVPGPIDEEQGASGVISFYGTDPDIEGFYILITSDVKDEYDGHYKADIQLGFNSRTMQTSYEFDKVALNIFPVDEASIAYTDYIKQHRGLWEAVHVTLNSDYTLEGYEDPESITDLEALILQWHKEQPWPKQPGTPQMAATPLSLIFTAETLQTLTSTKYATDIDKGRVTLMTIDFDLTMARTIHLKNNINETVDLEVECLWDRMGFRYMPFSNCYVKDTVNTHTYPLQNTFSFHANGTSFYPSSLQERGHYQLCKQPAYEEGWHLYDYLYVETETQSSSQKFNYVIVKTTVTVERIGDHPVTIVFQVGQNATSITLEPGVHEVEISIPIITGNNDMTGEQLTLTFHVVPDEDSDTDPAKVTLSNTTIEYSMSPTVPAIPTVRKEWTDRIKVNDNVLYDLRSGSGEVEVDEGLILTDDVKYHLTQTIMKVLNEELYLTDKTKWYLKESMDKHMGTLVTLADDAKYLIDTPGVKKLLDKVYLDDNVKSSITTQIRNRINDELQR